MVVKSLLGVYCLPLQICQHKDSFISTTIGLVDYFVLCARVSNKLYSHFLKCCTRFPVQYVQCFHYNFVCYLCVQSSCRTYTTYILVFKGQLIGRQSFMHENQSHAPLLMKLHPLMCFVIIGQRT